MYFELGGVGIFGRLKPEGGGHGTCLLQKFAGHRKVSISVDSFPSKLNHKVGNGTCVYLLAYTMTMPYRLYLYTILIYNCVQPHYAISVCYIYYYAILYVSVYRLDTLLQHWCPRQRILLHSMQLNYGYYTTDYTISIPNFSSSVVWHSWSDLLNSILKVLSKF